MTRAAGYLRWPRIWPPIRWSARRQSARRLRAARRRRPAAGHDRGRAGDDRRPQRSRSWPARIRLLTDEIVPWPELWAAARDSRARRRLSSRHELSVGRRADPVQPEPPANRSVSSASRWSRQPSPSRLESLVSAGADAADLPRGGDAARRRRFAAAGPLDQTAAPLAWNRPRSPPWPSSGRRSSPASPRESSPWTPRTGSRWSTRRPCGCSPCRADPVGPSLDELAIARPAARRAHRRRRGRADAVVIRSGRVLVLNRMPVVHDGRLLGSVTTLRDRTQLAELET